MQDNGNDSNEIEETIINEETASKADAAADAEERPAEEKADAKKDGDGYRPLLWAIGGAVIMLAITGLIAMCAGGIKTGQDVSQANENVREGTQDGAEEEIHAPGETEADAAYGTAWETPYIWEGMNPGRTPDIYGGRPGAGNGVTIYILSGEEEPAHSETYQGQDGHDQPVPEHSGPGNDHNHGHDAMR